MPKPPPGKMLLQFMQPNGLSQNRLAREIDVPPRRINEIILGKRSITADTAIRLARYFGNDALFWMTLQAEYEIALATEKIGTSLATIAKNETATCKTSEVGKSVKDATKTTQHRSIKRRVMR